MITKSEDPLWSILICTVRNRRAGLACVWDELEQQIEECGAKGIEILSFCDNKMRTVGYKRQAMLDIARGRYLSFVDDDDMPLDGYIREIYSVLTDGPRPDVVSFNIKVTIDGAQTGVVHMGMRHVPKQKDAPLVEYEPPGIGRPPHMLAVWRTEIARKGTFPDITFYDDFMWAEQVWPHVSVERKIDKIIYHWVGRSNEKETVGA